MLKNNSNKDFCCNAMKQAISEKSEIFYDARFKSFSLKVSNSRDGTRRELYYCSWCGTKLPKDLDETWSNVLREEYGINDPIFEDKDKVPEEFQSDAWWKKRGL